MISNFPSAVNERFLETDLLLFLMTYINKTEVAVKSLNESYLFMDATYIEVWAARISCSSGCWVSWSYGRNLTRLGEDHRVEKTKHTDLKNTKILLKYDYGEDGMKGGEILKRHT